MSTFKLVNSETVNLTHAIAVAFRDMKPSPTEREINPGRVKHLTDKINSGLAIPFQWAKVRMNGEELRVNGQHTSTILAGMNGSMPDNLKATIDEYEVDSVDGLALLFRQFDDRKSGRGPADVAGAYQGLYPQISGVPKPVAKLAVEGAAWQIKYVAESAVLQGDDVYTMMGKAAYHPFINWMGTVYSVKTPELKNKQVAAAMYSTYDVNAESADVFWDLVARGGDEFDEMSPATVLDCWLKDIKEKKIEGVKPGNFYQGCIYAWNAWRDEKQIRTIRSDISKGYSKVTA